MIVFFFKLYCPIVVAKRYNNMFKVSSAVGVYLRKYSGSQQSSKISIN